MRNFSLKIPQISRFLDNIKMKIDQIRFDKNDYFLIFTFRMVRDSRQNSIVIQPNKANRARFNVGGTRFETYFATLDKYPGKI